MQDLSKKRSSLSLYFGGLAVYNKINHKGASIEALEQNARKETQSCGYKKKNRIIKIEVGLATKELII